ncbi:hypothetical protein Clacol_004600 [Clathrus columnatus]|uniref:Uncharacterized protein n=1 Tax=Clathrus columnatus TaxID=1419009 RepID=A0AAV5ACD4_9AGAM|nr:hypothetical protein Clacol_004600 [Clathrus columnatus]
MPFDNRAIAPAPQQGNMEDLHVPMYDEIIQAVCTALRDGYNMDPAQSPLAKAGVKLTPPETYSGNPNIKELELFIAGVLHWLSLNYLLGHCQDY